MRYTNLTTESPTYLAARDALRVAEFDLMRQREEVAELRRQLPPGPILDDYVLFEGARDLSVSDVEFHERRLGELFSNPDRPLLLYHLMFGKAQTEPCPMCTMWIDGLNAVADHVDQRADLAIVAAAPLDALRAHARQRGWDRLRLLSAGSSTFKLDLGSEDELGNQDPRITVMTKQHDGGVRLFYAGSPHLADDVPERGIDLFCPTWHLFDLTPEGRGDWYASLNYR